MPPAAAPAATTAPTEAVATEAPTEAATMAPEATATAEMTPTAEMTATVEMTPTVEMTATVEMTPTVEMTATAVTTAATVMVTENDTLGKILTDDKGMTLYLFTNDTQGTGDTAGTSNCYDKCAVNWPPLLTSGDAVAGEGANADLLGTTERKDGTSQVTYNGWPLYYWFQDKNPGDATGQGVGEVWYVLSPEGEMIKTAP